MIATTIEQSKHLLELGLDPNTADCMWLVTSRARLHVLDGEPISNYDRWENYPAWSLSALLEVIPKECEPDIQKSPISGVYFAYCFADRKAHITDDHGNAIDAAYEMACWLLERGLIKKG